MEIILWAIWAILIIIAFTGCFISKFPGPILAFAAILIAKLCMSVGDLIEWWNIVVIGILVVASFILNRMIPKWTKKLATYGKGGNWGAIVGSIAALIIVPSILTSVENPGVSITLIVMTFLVMPFIFATGFELISQKDFVASAKSGGGATITYICTTFVKLFTVVYSVYLMFANN
ncbi:MAG: DUF456 domain-containing protein [Muribaculaceae bacterium]|nr:DUF456 domain-containing protein [Muribaculaceae bacterium]